MKYIDAEKLKTEIERLYKQNKCDFDNGCNEDQCYGYDIALSDLQIIIDSLQQEQPDEDSFKSLVKEMRDTQKEYFRTRDKDVLRKSKDLEKQVDRELKKDENPSLF